MDTKELEDLYQALINVNERALDDDDFYDILPKVFNENIEDLIARLHNVLEEEGYFSE